MFLGRIFALLLILCTLAALIWQSQGMKIRFRIEPGQNYSTYVFSDRSNSGRSKAKLINTETELGFDCKIVKKYEWPYCKIEFWLSDFKTGLDLSRYSTVFIKTSNVGPGNPRVRITVGNYHESYSNSGENGTLKPNFFEYIPSAHPEGVEIKLSDFQVTSWWLSQYNIPFEQTNNDFRNVPLIQIQNVNAEEGQHRLLIDYIEFRGQRINANQIYLAIISCWMIFAAVYILSGLSALRVRLYRSAKADKELAQLNAILRLDDAQADKIASKDPLTQCLSRAGIRQTLHNELLKSKSGNSPLSLIFLDIDHFKSINDKYGHGIGDAVLIEFTELIQREIRESELLTRWGGEEFFILCSTADLFIAKQIAEKLRIAIETFEFSSNIRLTCSFGVGQIQKREATDQFFKRVESALHKSKDNNRNCVTLSPK